MADILPTNNLNKKINLGNLKGIIWVTENLEGVLLILMN